ncbi:MAG: endonuclease [Cystobacterineae bacterium]|nr:endonuclease [Cystobacterineae bacterium]
MKYKPKQPKPSLLASMLRALFLLSFALPISPAFAAGNVKNDSFSQAKRMLSQKVYFDHRITLYCSASYDKRGNISLPEGFETTKAQSRASRIEWEHIVPAENFGRSFREWREGNPLCVDRHGKAFKGRNCAEKANREYRYMQADMHNLAPAIGAVNAARKNYHFMLLPEAQNAFGICPMKIEGNRAEPPESARGIIARTYLYMQAEYPRYQMGKPQKKLMEAWNKTYPPDQWECTRARRIAKIQGNVNKITEARCKHVGL